VHADADSESHRHTVTWCIQYSITKNKTRTKLFFLLLMALSFNKIQLATHNDLAYE